MGGDDKEMSAAPRLSRRQLIVSSAATALSPVVLRSAPATPVFGKVASTPDSVRAQTESGIISLARNGSRWTANGVELRFVSTGMSSALTLRSSSTPLLRLHLRWQMSPSPDLQYLGDQWERSYGDLAWRTMEPERVLPWYFLAANRNGVSACGVKTGPAAFCFWQVDPEGVSLWLDVRNGGRAAQLGSREVALATVVSAYYPQLRPAQAAARFCRLLCDKPRLPSTPVYGGNNWYYAYGKSSADDIRGDSERIASLSSSSVNRPFMVIDDGWQPNPTAGPWVGNSAFGDMSKLAADMQRIGVEPGLWIRPLFTNESVPESWHLKSPNAGREFKENRGVTLDPTIPEALAKIQTDLRTDVSWGYKLIKHDFSTYDLFGRWGKSMGAAITDSDWNFSDRTRTNAEIVLDLYTALRKAAGTALVLGCNTVGHLSAGLFELQRTGDDTSGRDWDRTRRMGVNTLAFRIAQQNTFFAVDADCVGLTKEISWQRNKQWLDLLAHSGTPLFVSPAPDAIGAEQRAALKDAFALAAVQQPLGEPLDWMENTEPQQWKFGNKTTTYDWFGKEGCFPFNW